MLTSLLNQTVGTSLSVVRGNVTDSELKYSVLLTLQCGCSGNCNKFEVVKGEKYKITYFDNLKSTTMIGKVKTLSENSMSAYRVAVDENDEITISNSIVLINYSNIINIEEYKPGCVPPPPPCNPLNGKEISAVALMGISAELIQSLVVKLRFYDDTNYDSEVIPVTMEKGKKYQITYVEHDPNHTVFEVIGTLKDILYNDDQFANGSNGFIREECNCQGCYCSQNEQPGWSNTVYNTKHFMELPKGNTLGDQVRFVLDTSEAMEEHYDTIWLKDIRKVEEITDETETETEEDTEEEDQFVVEVGNEQCSCNDGYPNNETMYINPWMCHPDYQYGNVPPPPPPPPTNSSHSCTVIDCDTV